MRNAILPVLVLTAACGDNLEPDGPETETEVQAVCTEAELPAQIAALVGAKNVVEQPCGDGVVGQARCFALTIEQPLHHDAPDGLFLDERVFLVHRGCDRPTVVADWGYATDGFFDDELTVLFRANALWLEHRFQGQSTPAGYAWDWTALTIANGAADMHRVIDAFKHIYGGRWVSTGASKGGITATYHRYFYRHDVDGTIPYVAPASRDRVDPEYQTYLKSALPEPCASRIRDAQVAALTSRRTMMLDKLAEQAGGFESDYLDMMAMSLDWGFWQAWGVNGCRDVPSATASDDSFYGFFEQMTGAFGAKPPGGDLEAMSSGALGYEWLTQQGFALQIGDHVAPLLQSSFALATMEDRFREEFPSVDLPDYDDSTNFAVRTWVERQAEDMLFLYGEVDPWSGGALPVPTRPSSARFFVPRANHSAQLSQLVGEARTDAFARASEMFGEPPMMSLMTRASEAASQRALRFRASGITNAFLLLKPTGEVRCAHCSQDSPR